MLGAGSDTSITGRWPVSSRRSSTEGAMVAVDEIGAAFERATAEAANAAAFQRLWDGRLSRGEVRELLANVFRTHYLSPHVLAFVFALAPGPAAAPLLENLREELGEAGEGPAHPDLLRDLVA